MELSNYEIIFKGEISSGYDLETVKENIADLFKLDSNQLEKIFSGSKVILKKDLTNEEAQQYQDKLKSFGLIIYLKEKAMEYSITETVPEDIRSVSPIYYPRKIRGTANNAENHSNLPIEPPDIWSFDFSGRCGRLNYINALCIVFLVLGIGMVLALYVPAITKSAIIFLAVILLLLTIRIVALRLHDLNLSAWLSWLFLLPVIGLIISLVLLVCPGSEKYNKYGNPAVRGSFSGLILALGLLVSSPLWFATVVGIIQPAYEDFIIRLRVDSVYQDLSRFQNEVETALKAEKTPIIGNETINEDKYYPIGMVSGNITQSSSTQASIQYIAVIGLDKTDNDIKMYASFAEEIPQLQGVTLTLQRKANGVWHCVVHADKEKKSKNKYLPKDCKMAS